MPPRNRTYSTFRTHLIARLSVAHDNPPWHCRNRAYGERGNHENDGAFQRDQGA